MPTFIKTDVNQVTWGEFDQLIGRLVEEISSDFTERNESVDIIAPLLRTGGIVGGVMAIKMHVFTMLPVRFKYSYKPTTINQILSIPDVLTKVPENMNILLCEGNTSSGSIAVRAAAAIRVRYPKARIYLATLTKVYGGQEQLEGIEKIFYGQLTDENFKASEIEREKLGLRRGITIFPWENVDDELADINAV